MSYFTASWYGMDKAVDAKRIDKAVCVEVCEANNPKLKGVVGILGPGATMDQSASYKDAFSDASVASALGGDFGEAVSQRLGLTVRSKEMTRLVWGNNQPFQFTLPLVFVAFEDPRHEVMEPLKLLNSWAAVPAGLLEGSEIAGVKADILTAAPPKVQIVIGEKIMWTHCVIENVSTPLDKERDAEGNLLRAMVNLTVKSEMMLDQADINGILFK